MISDYKEFKPTTGHEFATEISQFLSIVNRHHARGCPEARSTWTTFRCHIAPSGDPSDKIWCAMAAATVGETKGWHLIKGEDPADYDEFKYEEYAQPKMGRALVCAIYFVFV